LVFSWKKADWVAVLASEINDHLWGMINLSAHVDAPLLSFRCTARYRSRLFLFDRTELRLLPLNVLQYWWK
jgi:hypothetical protein